MTNIKRTVVIAASALLLSTAAMAQDNSYTGKIITSQDEMHMFAHMRR